MAPTFAHTYFRSSMSKLDELYYAQMIKGYNKANDLGIKTLMTNTNIKMEPSDATRHQQYLNSVLM